MDMPTIREIINEVEVGQQRIKRQLDNVIRQGYDLNEIENPIFVKKIAELNGKIEGYQDIKNFLTAMYEVAKVKRVGGLFGQ